MGSSPEAVASDAGSAPSGDRSSVAGAALSQAPPSSLAGLPSLAPSQGEKQPPQVTLQGRRARGAPPPVSAASCPPPGHAPSRDRGPAAPRWRPARGHYGLFLFLHLLHRSFFPSATSIFFRVGFEREKDPGCLYMAAGQGRGEGRR